jgi:septal ring factor EnvC (AmiA/AmiB activator)
MPDNDRIDFLHRELAQRTNKARAEIAQLRRWIPGRFTTFLNGAGVSALSLFIALFANLIFINIYRYIKSEPRPQKQELVQRIGELTAVLNDSAKAVSEIENEFARRRELVRKLESDAETATKLSAVSREQAEAVAQALKIELEKREQSSFWSAHLTAIFYTLLGVAIAEIVHYVRNILRRRRAARMEEPQV